MNKHKDINIDINQENLLSMRTHKLFSAVDTLSDLRIFMEWHVFAVWDFMSLAKRLQCEYTCVSLPWIPPKNSSSARLINEIILCEETDTVPHQGSSSHFEIYLEAMNEIGADVVPITKFIKLLRQGKSWRKALNTLEIPEIVKQFVNENIELSLNGSGPEVLGSFFYGREDSIPDMFQNILDNYPKDVSTHTLFKYYLERHIALDKDEHGPATLRIINTILDENSTARADFFNAANRAILMRIRLWDGILTAIKSKGERNET